MEEEEETTVWEAAKLEEDNGNVERVPPENTTGGEEDGTEEEKEAGEMSELLSVWWGSGRLPTTRGGEEGQRDAGEVTSVLLDKENAGEVTSISEEEENVQDTERQETGMMNETQLVQERDCEDEKKTVLTKNKGKNQPLTKTRRPKKTVKGKVSTRWKCWSVSPRTPVKRMTPKVKVNKELLRKVFQLRKKRKASRKKKKLPYKINIKSVRCKIDTRNTLANNNKPELDLKVLESQPPPPGPARVKWAGEVAALKARQRSHRHPPRRTGDGKH